MSETKKPGAPNIKDLKAKLGLKTPGGAAPGADAPPPPGLMPPPGITPIGDAIPAPPGVEPPPGVRPPLGVTPPPGIAPPPALTPPPGISAPGANLVAPPGFQPPTPAAQPAMAQPPQHVDIDFDVVERKKSRRFVWIGVAVGASLLTMCGGYYLGDARLQRSWMTQSKKACSTTAEVVKKLDQGTKSFELALDAEVDKTKKGQTPLSYYNPDLISKLSDLAEAFDVNNPKLKVILNEQIWTTHYRFVKDARELLPRLHTFLAICAQLKIAVDVARGFENQFAEQLKKKTQKYQEAAAKTPTFGVMIQGDKAGLFFALGDPINKDGKKVDKHPEAEGYLLPNGRPGFFGKPQTKPTECPEVNGTVRMFSVDDAELNNRLKCRGQEDIVFEGWKGQVLAIKMTLKELEKVNPRDLSQRFQKSAGGN